MPTRYTFTDDSNDVRLSGFLTPDPADAAALTGEVLPVADPTGVTVDTTTYADSIAGGGAKLTTLVFPVTGQGALAYALLGDAFPRIVFPSDPTDAMLVMGDGTFNPYTSGSRVSLSYGGVNVLSVGGSVSASGAAATTHLAQLSQV